MAKSLLNLADNFQLTGGEIKSRGNFDGYVNFKDYSESPGFSQHSNYDCEDCGWERHCTRDCW